MKPYYTELENGKIMIEWIASDVRFCINIEVDPSESGWCFVTKDGTQNYSGYLPPEFVRLLTKRTPQTQIICTPKRRSMKKNFTESLGCGKMFGYLLVWLGGSCLSLALLYFDILSAEGLFKIMLPLLFISFARIQYLEDLVKEVEKGMNDT